jgi:RHH-type proline utilization regulon transcriptional repressor/proline dehydrogenase/delta 1-pyrroline-5-carboxylate dehydrogenase
VPPTVISGAAPQGAAADEEIIGPVLTVIKVKDMNEALAIANGTHYALTGGIYSRSPKNIERCIRELKVGNIYINRAITGAVVERQPFGGFNMSGMGSKSGGPDYLLQFMNPRTITENTLRSGFAPKEGKIENCKL